MHVDPGVGIQPVACRWRLVGAVVVADQLHVQLGGHLFVQLGQELAELAGPVPAVDRADHFTRGHVERGEQRDDQWRNLNDRVKQRLVAARAGLKVRPSRSRAHSKSTRRRARASRAWVWISRLGRLRW
jgi:hypothetical protein